MYTAVQPSPSSIQNFFIFPKLKFTPTPYGGPRGHTLRFSPPAPQLAPSPIRGLAEPASSSVKWEGSWPSQPDITSVTYPFPLSLLHRPCLSVKIYLVGTSRPPTHLWLTSWPPPSGTETASLHSHPKESVQ